MINNIKQLINMDKIKQLRNKDKIENHYDEETKTVFFLEKPATIRMSKICNFLKNHHDAKTLSINESNLTASDLNILSSNLEETHLQNLFLRDCNIDDDGIIFLASALEKNKKIINLDISNNQFKEKGFEKLSSMVSNNTSIVNLSINGNKISDVALKPLVAALLRNTSIKSIDISKTQITKQGVKLFNAVLEERREFAFINSRGTDINPRTYRDLTAQKSVPTLFRLCALKVVYSENRNDEVLLPTDITEKLENLSLK